MLSALPSLLSSGTTRNRVIAVYGFLITFADEHARDRYLPHPEHEPISTLAQQMAERVLVFDIAT